VRRLVADAGVTPSHHVLDLGAGHGAITAALRARGARVTAVELDRARLDPLRRRFADDPDVRVLAVDLRRLSLPRRPYRVVANPPFDLSTPVLRRLLDRPDRAPDRADLVLQRAAARRMADPSGPVALGWGPWFELTVATVVPRRAFRPPPKADAAVLVIERRPVPLPPPVQAERWRRFVAARQRRWAGAERTLRWWLRRDASRTTA